MSIGGNLKRLRIDRGLSQKELANKVNVTQPMIAQIERGTKAMTMELGKEISEVLKIPIDELLKETTAGTEM